MAGLSSGNADPEGGTADEFDTRDCPRCGASVKRLPYHLTETCPERPGGGGA